MIEVHAANVPIPEGDAFIRARSSAREYPGVCQNSTERNPE